MLTFILVVYAASATASFQTMGPFDTMAACDSMKSQMADNFKEIKSACLSMNTQALQSITAASSKYEPQKPVKAADLGQVPLPKARPRIKLKMSTKLAAGTAPCTKPQPQE